MLIDPRTCDLLLKVEHPTYKKDHEIFRHYGYYLDQLPKQPSLLTRLRSATGNALIWCGRKLNKETCFLTQPCH